jgi:hypothetical protein
LYQVKGDIMAEDGNVHPGSFVGDSVEEFKKLPAWGKIGVGLLFVVVAYLGYRQYTANKNAGVASPSVDTTGTGAGSGAMIGGVPQIPAGFSPQYNPTTGVLEGYQPTPPTGTGGGTTITGGQNQPLQGGNPPTGGQVPSGPLIPFGQYKGPSYSNLKPNTYYTYQGVNYKLTAGAQGRLWGINPSGQQVLLYAPQSQYPSVASPTITQSGGQNGATQVPQTRVS